MFALGAISHACDAMFVELIVRAGLKTRMVVAINSKVGRNIRRSCERRESNALMW